MSNFDLPQQFTEWQGQTAWKLEQVRRQLIDFLVAKGFEYIHPPFIDHYQTLALGAGTLNPDNAFRFTDPASGKLLAARTDISPQIARLDSKRPANSLQHYCYAGEVVIVQAESLNLRNPYQIGAEIFGDDSSDSDIKTIQLALQTIKQLQEGDILIDIGHSGITKLLLQSLELNSNQLQQLLRILELKSKADLERFCQQLALPEANQQLLFFLINQNTHDLQQLDTFSDRLRQVSPADKVEKCLKYWHKLCQIINHVEQVNWHIDLANLTGINYHTGYIFSIYQNQQLVCRGGRYDNVLGHQRPATGFTLDINRFIGH